ncbi:coiled-coil domain-containing protein 116 [Rousettus aegyptiacus]|uniref:coiled-coil domain-containing protein 116 n=1 Tax=Rousettus aegyptiacus TaxID=9407 RepID=UPI00168CE0DC|nr:coiled-coil domain-containing protein 116 [Rousettus aegyptiacus]
MTSCRHHSGYLADDEAGHTTYVARVQPHKKPAFSETGQASKLGHVPHPPSMYGPSSSSGLHSHRRNSRGPRPFGSFLDFLVEGQVLDSLQTVVEKATEHMATMKTEAGVPLVEVQDPVEVPRGGRRVRARPSLSTVHRHRVRPSLCIGNPNNYPSCSSSMSDSQSNFTAGWPGSHSRDSDMGYHGLGPLPPRRDKLLQEKSLKRLLRLENRGKSLGQSSSQRGSLLCDSMGSQSSSQWTPKQPLSWFSGLLGSSSGAPEASDLGPAEQELIFLKREFNKEIKSLLSQPTSFDLPSYCSLREPHRTLDFLAAHRLFPALQNVVNQAADKLSGARRQNGCPLFPTEWEPTTEPNSEVTPGSEGTSLTEGEAPYSCSLPTRNSSIKMVRRKSIKPKGGAKPKEGGSPMSSTQGATRFRLQSPSYKFVKKKTLPSISSTMPQHSNPWYEELVNYLMEQAVSLLICKYKFERNLTKQLGFISFPITEALMDLLLGFKKVKGSHIRLSSKVNWSCLLKKLEEGQRAQQVSKPVSRPTSLRASQRDTSQHSTSQRSATHRGTAHPSTSPHSPETPSTLPKPATVVDQEAAAEPSLHTESLGPQLPTPQEKSTAEEQEPTSLSEPITGMGSNQYGQAVDVEEGQRNEEEVEEEEYEEYEEEEEEEEEETVLETLSEAPYATPGTEFPAVPPAPQECCPPTPAQLAPANEEDLLYCQSEGPGS